MRTNPKTNLYSGYYRLVESYRNQDNRICHRTILNTGYLDDLSTDQLNLIQKILTLKDRNMNLTLFEYPYTNDEKVIQYVEEFYNRMVAQKRIDVLLENQEKKSSKSGKDIQKIDINSIRNKDVREIEATFRTLKTDTDLRPIFHKKDESTMAHLHLGLLAYWVVNTIRHQFKKEGIHSGWREIVRIMNTQKAVTTLAQNEDEEVILIRRCSEPNQSARKLYDALKYKYAPFVKKKSVVHKSELDDCQLIEQQLLRPD